jgi:rhodanese-related sulfurtransferase
MSRLFAGDSMLKRASSIHRDIMKAIRITPMLKARLSLLSVLFACVFFPNIAPAADEAPLITTADAAKIIANDSTAIVLDVRTEAEFKGETGHLKNALLIPVQVLAQRIGELAPYKDRTIIVYCRTGRRSAAATELLRHDGFKAFNMAGGITLWLQEGRPTTKE